MKKLTSEELEQLEFISKNGRSSHKVIRAVKTLGIGEALHLKRSEWKMKSEPSQYISTLLVKQLGVKVKVRSLAHEKGWVIVRLA